MTPGYPIHPLKFLFSTPSRSALTHLLHFYHSLSQTQTHEAIPIIAITNASSGSLPSPSPIFSPGPSQDSIKMAKGPTFPETIYADLRHNKHISTARTLKRVTWTRHFIKETLTDASRVENAQIKGTDKPIPRLNFGSILRSFGEPEDDQISVALMIDQEYEHEHEHLINNYRSVDCQPRADLLPTDALGRQRIPYLINYRMRTMMPSLKQVSVHTPTLEHVAHVVIIEDRNPCFWIRNHTTMNAGFWHDGPRRLTTLASHRQTFPSPRDKNSWTRTTVRQIILSLPSRHGILTLPTMLIISSRTSRICRTSRNDPSFPAIALPILSVVSSLLSTGFLL